MHTKYSTVIFDKDGTLLDSSEGIINAARYAVKKLGVSFPAGFEQRKFIGPPLHSSYLDLIGIEPERVEQAVQFHREYYFAKGIYEASLYPGIKDLLQDLHLSGVKVCIATAKHYIPAGMMLEHFGLAPFIHYAAMNTETGPKSTKKTMIASVLDYCDLNATQAVMIGDTFFDVEGALGNGVHFIGVLYGYGSREEMENAGASTFAADAVELRSYLK